MIDLLRAAFDLNLKSRARILHPSCKAKLLRKPVDRRTKSDSLHGSAQHEAQSLVTNWSGSGQSYLPDPTALLRNAIASRSQPIQSSIPARVLQEIAKTVALGFTSPTFVMRSLRS
jgi:hypothetical protein